MSAFILNPEEIGLLAAYAAIHDVNKEDTLKIAQKVARELARENIRSVAYRYPNDKDGERPGPIGLLDVDIIDSSAMYAEHLIECGHANDVTPSQIIQMANCFDYQACETNDWQETLAHAYLMAIKNKALQEREIKGKSTPDWSLPGHLYLPEDSLDLFRERSDEALKTNRPRE